MASSMISSVAPVTRATAAQASMLAPFTGLKSIASFPVTRKLDNELQFLLKWLKGELGNRKFGDSEFDSLYTDHGRKAVMGRGDTVSPQVWPPINTKKFETLSNLPPLPKESLAKEVDYLLRMGWVPCLEFELEHGFVFREHHSSPGYYDGRYWTMWKLPMFGCTDSSQVLKEVDECVKEYPQAYVRIIGFDNIRQVQCISFIAHLPEA